MTIDEIQSAIRQFRDERDWMQFHDPKNMAIAISIEAGELLEHFLWKPDDESDSHARKHIEEIKDEMADIAIFLFELSENLGVNLLEAMAAKLKKNAVKYPVSKSKGRSLKYTEL